MKTEHIMALRPPHKATSSAEPATQEAGESFAQMLRGGSRAEDAVESAPQAVKAAREAKSEVDALAESGQQGQDVRNDALVPPPPGWWMQMVNSITPNADQLDTAAVDVWGRMMVPDEAGTPVAFQGNPFGLVSSAQEMLEADAARVPVAAEHLTPPFENAQRNLRDAAQGQTRAEWRQALLDEAAQRQSAIRQQSQEVAQTLAQEKAVDRLLDKAQGDLVARGESSTLNTSMLVHAGQQRLSLHTMGGMPAFALDARALLGAVPIASAAAAMSSDAGGTGPGSEDREHGESSDAGRAAGDAASVQLSDALSGWGRWMDTAQAIPLAATLTTAAGQLADGSAALKQDISLWIGQHLHAADIRLDAGTSAAVDVQVVMQGQQAQVHLRSEIPAVRQWLEQSQPLLAANLQALGVTLAGLQVSSQGAGQSGANGRFDDRRDVPTVGGFRARGSATADSALPGAVLSRAAEARANSAGGLDVFA